MGYILALIFAALWIAARARAKSRLAVLNNLVDSPDLAGDIDALKRGRSAWRVGKMAPKHRILSALFNHNWI